MSKVLNVRGKVLPAANQSVVLHAEMEDGTVVSGESQIPYSGKRIKRVFLSPNDIKPLPETVQAIREADLIVVGPGSLYTSILPNLLVPEIGKEVCQTPAKKVYICNLMTQAGETLDFTASDHVKALYSHMPCPFIDTILVNNEPIPDYIQEKYKEEHAKPVVYDVDLLKSMGIDVIFDHIAIRKDGVIRHNTSKVADILFQLLQDKK